MNQRTAKQLMDRVHNKCLDICFNNLEKYRKGPNLLSKLVFAVGDGHWESHIEESIYSELYK